MKRILFALLIVSVSYVSNLTREIEKDEAMYNDGVVAEMFTNMESVDEIEIPEEMLANVREWK
jgi:hypothetical protein